MDCPYDYKTTKDYANKPLLANSTIVIMCKVHFYSAAALLAMQSAVLATAMNSDERWSCPKQTVSTVCYKIDLSWYPVSSKLVSYTYVTLETRCLLYVPKIVDIDQYLFKLFENITAVRFFEPQCILISYGEFSR